MIRERQIEDIFIQKLKDLKYSYRPDINNRATLEQNFREKFERLSLIVCLRILQIRMCFSRLND